MFYTLYNEILFRPILNALVFFYSMAFHDLGAAIILLTVFIRLLLVPLFKHSLITQKKMSEIQPEIKKIQNEYKNNREEQAKRIMELYRERKTNPFSGCLPFLAILPVFITLYNVFLKIFTPESLALLYPFIERPSELNPIAFGFINLAAASFWLALAAGISQYLQAATMPEPPKSVENKNEPDMQKILSYQMKYFFPIFIFYISWQLSAGLALYWTVLNIFAIVQQKFIVKHG